MMEERSRTITLTFDVEVYYDEQIDPTYGADADGRRGVRRVEWTPTRAEVHQRVPATVEAYLTTLAMERLMEGT